MKFNDNYFRKLGHSPKVTALITSVAERVAATARATALVDTGDYRDGIHVEVVSKETRNVALVKSDDPKTLIIESETGNLVRALNTVKSGG